MSTLDLKSPAEADWEIAKIFRSGTKSTLSVYDESSFANQGWLNLGSISLPPSAQQTDNKKVQSNAFQFIHHGVFEWQVNEFSRVRSDLNSFLQSTPISKTEPTLDNLMRDIASIAYRCGLLLPSFDPDTLEEMPFKKSTTVVSDTSGILQGGLDFVARHLHPSARVKVPAIVNMELVNSADNFLKLRRSPKTSSNAFPHRRRELTEHLKSQGGQRAVLRLELHADTEIERTFLLGDPLRSAFITDKERFLSGLNITISIRSYTDRLILESARHHQAQSGPSHGIKLLTSDQGLARMTLAEGVEVMYFRATQSEDFFGHRLTGRTLDPFSGTARSFPLSSLLWELATAFGSVRLMATNAADHFTVTAIGEELSWSPYHSFEDLLWCETGLEAPSPVAATSPIRSSSIDQDSNDAVHQGSGGHSRLVKESPTFYRFAVGKMFRLICSLDDQQSLDSKQVSAVLESTSKRRVNDYRRFLVSAGLISIEGTIWHSRPILQEASSAIRNERIERIRELFGSAPSVQEFTALLEKQGVGSPLGVSSVGQETSSYRRLGEVTLVCASVHGSGIYWTPNNPEAPEFARIAMERFSELADGEELVTIGAWLERMIVSDGIHPEVARRRLTEASEKNLIRRFTEGSTTQFRHDDHVLHVLRVRSGRPTVIKVHLYRGDYLIPGKASVSLRLEGVPQ